MPSTPKPGPDGESEPTPRKPRSAWNHCARDLVRLEMFRRKLDYADLALRLEGAHGHQYSADALMTRVNRGTFTLAFYLELLTALGIEQVNLKEIPELDEKLRSR